jgi:hypothetical protein
MYNVSLSQTSFMGSAALKVKSRVRDTALIERARAMLARHSPHCRCPTTPSHQKNTPSTVENLALTMGFRAPLYQGLSWLHFYQQLFTADKGACEVTWPGTGRSPLAGRRAKQSQLAGLRRHHSPQLCHSILRDLILSYLLNSRIMPASWLSPPSDYHFGLEQWPE